MNRERQLLMELRAAHQRGRRRVRRGDVLQDTRAPGKPIAVVIGVDRLDRKRSTFDLHALTGHARLMWKDTDRVTSRSCESLRQLMLVRTGETIDDTPAARHRRREREVRVGDVLRDRARSGHGENLEAVVIEVAGPGGRAKLSWFHSGRSSRRAMRSLCWLELVREGPP